MAKQTRRNNIESKDKLTVDTLAAILTSIKNCYHFNTFQEVAEFVSERYNCNCQAEDVISAVFYQKNYKLKLITKTFDYDE
mgnify:CR=1 FL=1